MARPSAISARQLARFDCAVGGRRVAQHRRRRHAGLVAARDQHVDVAQPHLAQPGRRHHRAHLGVVDQHDARAERADVLVGGLHELAARRRDRAGTVAGGVFVRVAHVEQVERARAVARASARPSSARDALDAEAGGNARGRGLGLGEPVAPTGAARACPCRSRRRGRRGCNPSCRCAAPPPCSAGRR